MSRRRPYLTRAEVHRLCAELRAVYRYTRDPMAEDDERTRRTKWAVSTLPEWKRDMLFLYAHLRSMKEVGRIYGLSRQTVQKYINEIRTEIQDKIRKCSGN